MRTLKVLVILLLATGQSRTQTIIESRMMPASIHDLQAQLVERTYVKANVNAMIPMYVFRLTCTLARNDSLTAEFPRLRLVGSLPNKQTWSKDLSPEDCIQTSEGFVTFDLEVRIRQCGWATFTLTTRDAASQEDVYNYEVHSNFQQVYLGCAE